MREFKALNGAIRGVRMGRGRPVLAMHGFLDNAMSFKPLGDALSGIEVWAIDLPGHGLSANQPGTDGWMLMQWMPLLGRLLDELDWPHYDILGHSLGGVVGQLLASVDPRVRMLISLDALGPVTDTDEGNLDRLRRVYRQRADNGARRRYYSTPDALWRARLKGRFPLSERSARLMSWRGVGYNEHGWYHRYDRRLRQESIWRMTETQAQAMLNRLECPLYLALFERSPLFQMGAVLEERQRCVTRLHRQTFSGGHHAHMETPEPIARWIEHCLAIDAETPHEPHD